jgi:rSAM/selenodomain-associated transferase 1
MSPPFAPLCIGMMARAPVPGRCKTRLARTLGDGPSAALYGAMVQDCLRGWSRVEGARKVVLAAPEHDGVRVLRALSPPEWEVMAQQGQDLGERLRHALALLSEGGAAVALVDSDSPTVPVATFAERLRALGGGRRALFGPSDDGGYYLVGLGVPERGVLDGISWSTPEVLDQSLERCRALGLSFELLPRWYDVDDADDLGRLVAELTVTPERAPASAEILRTLGLLAVAP